MTARQNHKSDKKTAILEAALELIAANGFHGAPISKITEKAGVGVGSIYRYFTDKKELIHEVFRHITDETNSTILRDHDPDAPIREQFLHLSFNLFHYFIEHLNTFSFLEQYFNSPYGISQRREELVVDGRDATSKKRLPLFNLLEEARTQQIVKDLPSVVLAALSFGPILFLVREIRSGLFELDADTVRRTVEACWDAVKL